MFVVSDADAFLHLFVNTMRNMLSPDEAGAFILVQANSMQDAELRNSLKHDLDSNFNSKQKNIKQGVLDITNDDLAALKAIETIGVDSLSYWQLHNAGDWELVYNPMRALRSARASSPHIARRRTQND